MASYAYLAISILARQVISETMNDNMPNMSMSDKETDSHDHGKMNMTKPTDSSTDHSGHDHSGHEKPTASTSQSANAGGMTHSDHGSDHQMSPFLFTRITNFFVLFKEANIQSTGGFIAALIVSFLFAALTTVGVQTIHHFERKALNSNSGSKIAASFLHAFSQLLHYTAMLIVMTMNVWLILAVTAGHLVGWMIYALFLNNRFSHSTNEAKDVQDI